MRLGGRRYEENARGSLYGIWSLWKYRHYVEYWFAASCIMQNDSGDPILSSIMKKVFKSVTAPALRRNISNL